MKVPCPFVASELCKFWFFELFTQYTIKFDYLDFGITDFVLKPILQTTEFANFNNLFRDNPRYNLEVFQDNALQ